MIKFNLNDINDWDYGDDNIKKVYYNNSVCYQKISKGDSYNLFGKTTSSSPFTIKLNGVDETVTIVKDNGDGTYDWGLKYTNPISSTTNMCSGNTNLVSFDWGDADVSNLTSMGDYAFYNCTSLSSVTIPDSVTSIGISAFHNCSSLTSVTIPNSVTSIGIRAFWNCTSLASINIPSGVTSISSAAFRNCSSLTSVNIPSGVTSIGQGAFLECGNLTSVTIPNGVTSINESTFNKCSGLTSVTIPNSVTSFDQFAFYYCSSLTSVTIPSNVTRFGYQSFAYCSSLASITVEATTPPSSFYPNAFYNTNNCPIYVPSASVEAYKAASGWSTYADRIQAIP